MSDKKAVPDYDGSVWIEGFGEPFTICVSLNDLSKKAAPNNLT